MALNNNKISLVHNMAYPGPGSTNSVGRGEADENYLLGTLKKVADDPYFGAVELTHIKDETIRQKAAELLKASGKTVIFSAQPVQLSHREDMVADTDISSIDETSRRFALKRIFPLIDEAYQFDAEKFAFVSGKDTGSIELRPYAANALVLSIHEMCEYSDRKAEELGKTPLKLVIEQFDRVDEPGFKDQLVGPSSEAVEIAKQVRYVYHHDNFGLMYDLSHMPLIRDKDGTPETPAVLHILAPYLMHVHIGNCVTDKNDKKYGDSHVRMDYDRGAVSRSTLYDFVKTLEEIKYQGIIGFEVSPVKEELSDAVVNIHKAYFDEARGSITANYALGHYAYVPREFTPEKLFDMITEIRVTKPYVIADEAQKRKKRESLTYDGKLIILACDHPARHVTNVGSNPVLMGDRHDYLGRIFRVLSNNEIDGVMTTPDIMDDLFILSYIYREYAGESFLDNRVLVGCMNRSGLAGFKFEMDDRMTAYDAQTIHDMRLDASKILFRLDKDYHSKESIMTLSYCAKAIDDCNKYDLPIMIEPLPVEYVDGAGYRTKMDKDSLIATIGVAEGLGNSSRNHWIKIPYVDGYDAVVRSTTMPILMLGGASEGNPINTIENFERGMGAGRNVRGALAGRNVLYPGNDDPMAVAAAISRVIHRNYSADEAVSFLSSIRGQNMDYISKYITRR